MLITVKNNGKGAQGVYANGSQKAEFIRSKGSKRLTVTDEELARILRIPTLAVRKHEAEDAGEVDAGNDDGKPLATTGDDSPDLGTDAGDEVQHPVLEDADDEGEAGDPPAPVDGSKPWEKPKASGSKKK